MRRFLTVFFSFIMLSSSLSFAQNVQAPKKDLPFYFPEGIKKTIDPVKQWREYLLYLNATKPCLMGDNNAPFVLTSDNIVVKRKMFGAEATVEFDNFFREGDKVLWSSFCKQQYISVAQFNVLVDYVFEQYQRAVEMDFAYWGNFRNNAITRKASNLGIDEAKLRSLLAKSVPGFNNVTYRELHRLPPEVEKKNFLAYRILHFGFTPEVPVLGVAWLRSGVVYYTPMALIRDYLTGFPSVLQHELIHSNTSLQTWPTDEFDHELLASIPDMLLSENQVDFWFHSYSHEFREFVRVFFGFNFDQAREEIVKMSLMGNLQIDEVKFREYSKMLDVVKAELAKFFNGKDGPITELYSDRVFWGGFHDKMGDKNAVFRVMLSLSYNPTMLGGEKPTMNWLEAHRDEINSWARESYAASGDSNSGEDHKTMSFTALNLLAERLGFNKKGNFTEKKILEFARQNNISLDDLLKSKLSDFFRGDFLKLQPRREQ